MSQPLRPLHKRLAFDLSEGQVLDGPRRYLIMRADVLMGAFAKLEAEPRRLAPVSYTHLTLPTIA